MNIRKATEADIPVIVEMSRKFYATTAYAEFAPMDDDTVADLAAGLIQTGVVLVAQNDEGPVVGMVAMVIAPFMLNRHFRTAHEVVLWVEPTARGFDLGNKLLKAVAPACRAAGAVASQMVRLVSSPSRVGAMYEAEGYRLSELCHTKVL